MTTGTHPEEASPESPLPSFTNPPVTEVVLGVAFQPLEGLTIPRLGQLWSDELEEHFPKAEEQPSYEPPIESFDGALSPEAFNLRFLTGAFPLPRVWFLNSTGDELIQIQRNYFACNWRKVHPAAEYGRWESRRGGFLRWFGIFESFIASHGLGSLTPTQAEVTYVNHIVPNGQWSDLGDVGSVTTLVGTPAYSDERFGGTLEQIQLGAHYRLDGDGLPPRRLHATVQPARRTVDGAPMYVLELTVRGRPVSGRTEDLLTFYDLGREAIVTAFAAITPAAMHQHWGRHV